MSNVLYPLARQAFLAGDLDWDADNIKVSLVTSSYTYSASHQYRSSITSYENGTSANLGSKTVTNGVADAADTSLTATDATACNAIVVFQDSGSASTSCLIAYIDTPASGLPFTPSAGQTVNITWDNGANKIFAL